MVMFWLRKRMVRGVEEEVGFRVRIIWVRARKRQAPKESPTKTILEAGMGTWKDPGGGWRRDR